MTAMAERTGQMPVDEFERIAALVERETESVRFEFIDGRIGVKGMTDGAHGAITMWLVRLCMQARPDLDLNPAQGLKV